MPTEEVSSPRKFKKNNKTTLPASHQKKRWNMLFLDQYEVWSIQHNPRLPLRCRASDHRHLPQTRRGQKPKIGTQTQVQNEMAAVDSERRQLPAYVKSPHRHLISPLHQPAPSLISCGLRFGSLLLGLFLWHGVLNPDKEKCGTKKSQILRRKLNTKKLLIAMQIFMARTWQSKIIHG